MRGPGSPCDPWSPCLAAGSGQIPPGISILTDSVWIEIRVEFAQGPFLAGLPSGSAFLLSCRGTSLRTIAELARNWPGTASELPRKDGFTLVPTKMYFKKGKAKIELAVAKGKKQYDKRATKKSRDWNREKARYIRKSS